MDPTQDFKTLQDSVQKSLVSAVKTVNRVAAEDLGFQRTVNPDVAEQLDDKTARLLDLSTRLLQSAGRACNVKAPKLEDAEDVDMNWRSVVDVVDSVLEKADTAMDEYTGLVKRKEPPDSESGSRSKRAKSTSKVIRNANVHKPQLKFELQTDNFPTGPWKPLITQKPHATVPLEESFVTFTNDKGTPQHKHPYEAEISQMEYPERLYHTAEPIPPQPVETTQATWVDTYEGVLKMLKKLKKAKEIAVDLEHHDFRTYTGLVCLMQISTREQDWIVDTLQPWRHKLEILNEVFTDPSIVKVFHGAYMDMIWLQRDLGLYVNGLFDTYFACDILYSGKSLAFLLSKFVDFDADKQYQLADWRIRPIPEEMLYYARSDTHYLLYIYDRVRNDLVEASNRNDPDQDHIGRALQRSKELSLSRHEHPDFNDDNGEGSRGWYNYVFKHSHMSLNGEQFAVFKALWKWRDDIAREIDENPNFVLGTNSVAEIARVNPPDAKALHSMLPLTAPVARARFNDIWAKLQEAKAKGSVSLLHFFSSLAPESMVRGGLPKLVKVPAKMPELEGEVTVRRMSRSQLFGDMPISTIWDGSRRAAMNQDDSVLFPFPWQRFVEDVANGGLEYNEGDAAAAATPASGDVEAADASMVNDTAAEEADEEFTLKRGRKRKSEAVEEEDEPSEDDTSSESDEEMADAPEEVISLLDKPSKKNNKNNKNKKGNKMDSKKERKAQKQKEAEEAYAKQREAKMARKAKKAERKQSKEAVQKEQFNAVPFDYSTASSVMHANKAANGPDKGKKRVFDPYSKTGDEPLKGARKAPPVRGERSATFRK